MRGYDPRLLSKSPVIRQGSWAQVVNIGEKISHPLGYLQVHWEPTAMVWNLRKVYSDRKVCVWFSFLAKPDKQSVISSEFSQQKVHSYAALG